MKYVTQLLTSLPAMSQRFAEQNSYSRVNNAAANRSKSLAETSQPTLSSFHARSATAPFFLTSVFRQFVSAEMSGPLDNCGPNQFFALQVVLLPQWLAQRPVVRVHHQNIPSSTAAFVGLIRIL